MGTDGDATEKRIEDVAANIDRYFRRTIEDGGWLPTACCHHGRAMLARWEYERDGRPLSALLDDGDFLESTFLALRGTWRAFRPLEADGGIFRRELAQTRRHLTTLRSTNLLDYQRDRDLYGLVELFNAAKEIKGSAVKYVAVSKALYHLLPDLIVPMDAATARFLGWSSMPQGVDERTLAYAYDVFAAIAKGVERRGAGTLERLARLEGVDVPVPGELVRLGIARVVDLGLLGSPFVRRRARS